MRLLKLKLEAKCKEFNRYYIIQRKIKANGMKRYAINPVAFNKKIFYMCPRFKLFLSLYYYFNSR